MTQDTRSTEDFLKVKIDLPSVQLELNTSDPRFALSELRRILEVLNLDEDVAYEQVMQQDLRKSCSASFLAHAEAMGALKSLVRDTDAYRIATAEIQRSTSLDLDTRSSATRIASRDVQRAITRITRDIDCRAVRQGIIHICGDIERDGKVLIADNIHRLMPTAQMRAFHTRADDGRVLVECVFFGDFPEDEE